MPGLLTTAVAKLTALTLPAEAAVGVGVALTAIGATVGSGVMTTSHEAPVTPPGAHAEHTASAEVTAPAETMPPAMPEAAEAPFDTAPVPTDTASIDLVIPSPEPATAPPAELPGGLPSAADFGQSVATDALDGGVEGPQVAGSARTNAEIGTQHSEIAAELRPQINR